MHDDRTASLTKKSPPDPKARGASTPRQHPDALHHDAQILHDLGHVFLEEEFLNVHHVDLATLDV